MRYRWARPGDVNAFFGLMLDNIADMVLMVGLLSSAFGFPATFALRYMIPGTAIGVLAGDLAFTWMAFRLSARTGRNDITAMPLGLDTPSTFGMVFFVLGPAFLAAREAGASPDAAAHQAWQIGICALVLSGLFKLGCSMFCGWIRKVIPRAGLLGSLAAIALVLISFLPLIEILHYPAVGFVSLAIILTTLTAGVKLPGRLPGALGALIVGGGLYYLMRAMGWVAAEVAPLDASQALLPTGWLAVWDFSWVATLGKSLPYMPVVIPFALATIVGGIDCTESAAAAGDDYPTGQIIAVEGAATLLAGLCGGVIQTTPYIGHPAYKVMGGRAAYTLATALFIGSAGLLGYFGYLYVAIPKAAIFPILIFVGLEITAQSFHATPRRHYTAVALACLPALAALLNIYVDQVMAAGGLTIASLEQKPGMLLLAKNLQTLKMLAGGFVVSSLLWASVLAAMVDRRLNRAAVFLLVASACSLVGVIHSPLPGSPLALPWTLTDLPHSAEGQSPYYLAAGYGLTALLLWAWNAWSRPQPIEDDPQC